MTQLATDLVIDGITMSDDFGIEIVTAHERADALLPTVFGDTKLPVEPELVIYLTGLMPDGRYQILAKLIGHHHVTASYIHPTGEKMLVSVDGDEMSVQTITELR